jgi:hypothetical protein
MKASLQATTLLTIYPTVSEPFLLFERYQAIGYVPSHFAQPFLSRKNIRLPLWYLETTRLSTGFNLF